MSYKGKYKPEYPKKYKGDQQTSFIGLFGESLNIVI